MNVNVNVKVKVNVGGYKKRKLIKGGGWMI